MSDKLDEILAIAIYESKYTALTQGSQQDVKKTKLAILDYFKGMVPEKKAGGKGMGCKCYASYYGECGCQDIDWNDYDQWNNCVNTINSNIEKEGG